MEGHRSRRPLILAVLAGLVALGLLAAGPAGAAEDSVGGSVDPSGVTITIVRWQGQDSVHATGADGGADPTGCDWAIVPAPLGLPPPPDIGPYRPDAYLGLLTCNGVGVEIRWVGPGDVVDLEAEARRLVEEYVARVPVPQLTVHANPAPTGLVGLESWFWATGFDGQPVVDSIDAFGIGVDVRIDPGPPAWSFGDGASANGDLGQAFPTRSSIRHAYTTRGTRTVAVTFEWQPRYRIDGTDWIELPMIPVEAGTRLPRARGPGRRRPADGPASGGARSLRLCGGRRRRSSGWRRAGR